MIRKSVLITGASGDIGFAIAKKFAQNGYDIIATYNNGNLKKLSDFCSKLEVKFLPIKMDISQYEQVKAGFERAFKESDYLDCVICNSGISKGEKLLCDSPIEDIDEIINTNLLGTIYCNREAIKGFMKHKHGNIINISSIYGLYGGSCESVYSASKAGIIALTESLSGECGDAKIRVNAIAPGFIETKMTSCFSKDEKKMIANNIPLGRLGKGEDVANVALFLASDDASYITGETITLSGGAIKF